MRYEKLQHVLREDVGSVISLRNKLAHGQWHYPLNESLDDIAQPQMDALRSENVLRLKHKALLIERVCMCVNDLAVSRPTFERDFDIHFGAVEQVRTNLKTRRYDAWAKNIRSRHMNGRQTYASRLSNHPSS